MVLSGMFFLSPISVRLHLGGVELCMEQNRSLAGGWVESNRWLA
jgi:hypothetical protein